MAIKIAVGILGVLILAFSIIYIVNESYALNFEFENIPKWEKRFYSQNFDPEQKKIFLIGSSHTTKLDVLHIDKYLKEQGQRRTKSGIMLGLGETREEVIATLHDLKENDVDVVTIGQYLQPSKKHLPVKQFVLPTQFEEYKQIGLDLGFRHVESSALVRSSYKAQKHIN